MQGCANRAFYCRVSCVDLLVEHLNTRVRLIPELLEVTSNYSVIQNKRTFGFSFIDLRPLLQMHFITQHFPFSSEKMFAIMSPSVRLCVCLSVVCITFVRPTQAIKIFGNG